MPEFKFSWPAEAVLDLSGGGEVVYPPPSGASRPPSFHWPLTGLVKNTSKIHCWHPSGFTTIRLLGWRKVISFDEKFIFYHLVPIQFNFFKFCICLNWHMERQQLWTIFWITQMDGCYRSLDHDHHYLTIWLSHYPLHRQNLEMLTWHCWSIEFNSHHILTLLHTSEFLSKVEWNIYLYRYRILYFARKVIRVVLT